jgi:hypothetical protein
MKKIDWDAAAGNNVNPYMETLTKETGTLHRVLSKHLPETTVMMIMDPVFRSYRDQWTRAFEEVTVRTEAGKQRYVFLPTSELIRSNHSQDATGCGTLPDQAKQDRRLRRLGTAAA